MSATVERWRMPSGRVATIDLRQSPEAIEDARNLLREFGDAELIKEGTHPVRTPGDGQKEAPDAVVAARGDDQNTNTHEGEPITMDATNSAANVAPDALSQADIADWIDDFNRLIDTQGAPITDTTDPRFEAVVRVSNRQTREEIEDLISDEGWQQYFGRLYFARVVDKPMPPVEPPAWATSSNDLRLTGYPEVIWQFSREFTVDGDKATLTQSVTAFAADDVAPDGTPIPKGSIIWDSPSLWFDKHLELEDVTATGLRALAATLLDVAEAMTASEVTA